MASDLPGADSFWQSQRLRIFILCAFFIGIFLLALGGGLFLFRGSQEAGDIQIISQEQTEKDQIVVHVDGAVKTPGVYKLAADLRVADAVAAAGGFARDADSKNVNLAAKISDGQKIYVPAVGESSSTTFLRQDSGGQASITGLVNINTASESELDKLPGIGPVTAGKIIASRPYSGLEDLLTKKVVSASVFAKIKDSITTY